MQPRDASRRFSTVTAAFNTEFIGCSAPGNDPPGFPLFQMDRRAPTFPHLAFVAARDARRRRVRGISAVENA